MVCILEYIPFYRRNFSHNDVHGGNLMMDKNGTADSVILVDFDLASYGFPALDLACLMFYSSLGCKRLTNDLSFKTLLITLIQVKNT